MNFYEEKRHLWDFTIHNNEHMNKLLAALMAVVSEVNSVRSIFPFTSEILISYAE